MKILILGGTRYFGRLLAEQWIEEEADVTLFTRGEAALPRGAKGLKGNRNERSDLKVLTRQDWDLVYDQLGFSAQNAQDLCEALKGNCGHLVFTSSGAVYDFGSEIEESAFQAQSHALDMRGMGLISYKEGKRQAEAYYAQEAPFSVGALRLPIILGQSDPTQRLVWHFERLKSEEEVYFPNLDARIDFLSAEDAARALYYLGAHSSQGAFNASSGTPLAIGELLSLIRKAAGSPLNATTDSSAEWYSPFGIEEDWFMKNAKLFNELAFQPAPELIARLSAEIWRELKG